MSFESDLNYSLESNFNNKTNKFYKSYFKDVKEIEEVCDLERQRDGIDKIIRLTNGKEILIDEKRIRKDYNNILLEEYSDYERKKEGWLLKLKKTDYIVYIIESKKIYIIPYQLLRSVFIDNRVNWANEFGRVFADNKTYKTSNIPIPIEKLFNEIYKKKVLK